MTLFEVAVAAPLSHTLTYAAPEIGDIPPVAGMRVLVPLGRQLVTGYVLGGAVHEEDEQEYTIRPIVEVLDSHPLFPENLIPFYRWIADYYHHPIGEVIRTALPGGLTIRSGHRIVLTDSGGPEIARFIDEKEKKGQRFESWLRDLLDRGELSPAVFRRICRRSANRRLLKKWQKQGYLVLEPQVIGAATGARYETCVRPTAAEKKCRRILETREQVNAATTKTLDALFTLCDGTEAVARKELTREYRNAASGLRQLADLGLVTMEERRVYRNPFGERYDHFTVPETLTAEQEQVLASILPAVESRSYRPFLLHGITGSGKTEVYLRAAARALELGRSVLVLVPEIALATQLESHFLSRFGEQTAVLHSALSAGERFDQWQRIVSGEALIVIGARSAVFAPLADPGLIVVDEEHESAYKQDGGLRYNGRDLAILRARQAGCPVVLGSATPSVTSYFHARHKKYGLLTMTRRIADRRLPTVEIIDLNRDKTDSSFRFFTKTLLAAIHDNLALGHQTLLFVNRRGYAGFMLCRDCGHIIQCRHCRVSLTHHRGRDALVCHYCGYTARTDITCPQCRSGRIIGLGVGSERIEEEIRRHVPRARVARLDSDTTVNRKEYLRILKAVRQQEVDILVGTQMIAKGLHFPHMTLVGIVWADSGLGIPDFRASERTFQLLAQVTGRAGRGKSPGRVLIQTHQPEHYTIRFAREHDYESLYHREMEQRRQLRYPPCSRLVNIRLSGESEAEVERAAQRTAAFVRILVRERARGKIDILGPAPAPLARIRNRSRFQLLLKSENLPLLHSVCSRILENCAGFCRSNEVRLSLDVDPENMM